MLQFYRLVLHVAKKLARGEKPPCLYSGHTTVQCTVYSDQSGGYSGAARWVEQLSCTLAVDTDTR